MNKRLKYFINFTMTLLLFLSIQGAYSMQPVKYVVGFKSYNTNCIIYVNGAKAISNGGDQGPIMAGVTMSAFLENGANTVAFEMASFSDTDGNNKYNPDATCELTVSKRILHEKSEERVILFKLYGSVDEDLKPTGKTSPDYEENQVIEGPVKGTEFYRVSKTFEISGLPEWKWVKATPFEATEENMEKLRQAYREVWNAINAGNEQKFQELSHISFSESAAAAFYPGSWYQSLDFDKDFKKSVGAMPINWDDYKLVILNKGRLVKLENDKERSPLGFKNSEGKLISTYNPYFSLIDGSMIITR